MGNDHSNRRCSGRCEFRVESRNHITPCSYSSLRCSSCEDTYLYKDMPEHSEQCMGKIVPCPLCRVNFYSKKLQDHTATCNMRLVGCLHCKRSFPKVHVQQHESQECQMRKEKCIHCNLQMPLQSLSQHQTICDRAIVSCPKCPLHLERCSLDCHIRDTCPETLLNCTNCMIPLKRKDFKEHAESCPMEPLNCHACNMEVVRQEMAVHLGTKCPDSPLDCHHCREMMKRNHLEHHLKEDCPLVETSCPLECQATVLRKNMDDHLNNSCLHKILPCDFCEESFILKDLEDHKKTCGMKIVACEHCRMAGIEYRNLETHLTTCPEKLSPCPFKESLGCEFETRQQDLPGHSGDYAFHFPALVNKMLELNTLDQDISAAIPEHERDQAQLKSDISSLEGATNDVQENLLEIKQELVQVLKSTQLKASQQEQWEVQNEDARSASSRRSNASSNNAKRARNYNRPKNFQHKNKGPLSNDSNFGGGASARQLDNIFPSRTSNAGGGALMNNRPSTSSLSQPIRTFAFSDERVENLRHNNIWKIYNFSSLLSKPNIDRWSPLYCNDTNGYHFRVNFNCRKLPRTSGLVCGIFMCLQRGSNDKALLWPFTHTVVVSLFNHHKEDWEEMCHISRKNIPEQFQYRLNCPEDGINRKVGYNECFPLDMLTSVHSPYISSDTIVFQIHFMPNNNSSLVNLLFE